MTTVLLVEDDPAISEPLARAFGREGYAVRVHGTGKGALEEVAGADIIVLDLGLPDMDGLDVARQVRSRGLTTPILMLTARSEATDLVVGLDAGADDYVTKPFRLAELLARVRAQVRRASGEATEDELTAGQVRVDVAAHRAFVGSRELQLTTREFELLRVLVRGAGAVVRNEDILKEVWGEDPTGTQQTLQMHVTWLRRKLGDDVDASLDHRHDLVPFAFEGGEHGRGFVRQTRLADGLDRGRDRLGHGAVGPIGRHRRNGECKQHRARLAPASTEAQARTAGVADGWPSRARKRRRARPELLTVGPRERGSARAAERLRIVKPGQPPRVWRRVCIGALGVDAPRRAAGVLFKLFATGVAPQTASVLDQRPSSTGIRQRPASCRAVSIEQKIDNSFF